MTTHQLRPRGVRALRALTLLTVGVLAAACSDSTTGTADPDIALARGGGASKATNTLQVLISGLPGNAAANVTVTGGGGYSQVLTASATLTDLNNGSYTVSAESVTAGGVTYAPSPETQSTSLKKGETESVSVVYNAVASTGTLSVSISIASGVSAAVNVSGPNGFARSLTSSATYPDVAPGDYTISASSVTAGVVTYNPAPATQSVTVNAGATASGTVVYTPEAPPEPSGFNLRIAGMYLTQSVQTMSGAVPMVAGRDAMLRVFAVANDANSAQPAVRARIYRNGTLVSTLTANAPTSSVPLSVNEGSSTASWNIPIPASLVQGGLSIVADVDPTNAVTEGSETDNQFPLSGVPLAFNVRSVPTLSLRYVPVLQQSTGQLGNVTSSNGDAFLQRTRDMFPLSNVSFNVRSAYTTTRTVTNASADWSAVLSELRALRTADGSADHYYGVAKVSYSSGIAGIGYIGLPTSMGWDYLSSGSEVMAHELGHNFGRQHAPCGGVSGADPNFPYAGGAIGVYGFNVRVGQLLSSSTADLMGYCNPTWVSDYTYNAILTYRGSTAAGFGNAIMAGASAASQPTTSSVTISNTMQPSVLVWGRVTTDGSIVLEPAVRMTARSVLPSAPGRYTAEARDQSGNVAFSISFEPDMVAVEDGSAPERHFAFMVPVGENTEAILRTLTVRGNGRQAERISPLLSSLRAGAEDVTIDAVGGNRARVRWDTSALEMVVIRDAVTGEVLSFARGGDATVATSTNQIELVSTDGVRSSVRTVNVRGR